MAAEEKESAFLSQIFSEFAKIMQQAAAMKLLMMKKLAGQDKNREIAHQLPLQSKQTPFEKINLTYYQLRKE